MFLTCKGLILAMIKNKINYSCGEEVNMPTVQHFEIAADKIKRAQEFYKKILDRITKNA